MRELTFDPTTLFKSIRKSFSGLQEAFKKKVDSGLELQCEWSVWVFSSM